MHATEPIFSQFLGFWKHSQPIWGPYFTKKSGDKYRFIAYGGYTVLHLSTYTEIRTFAVSIVHILKSHTFVPYRNKHSFIAVHCVCVANDNSQMCFHPTNVTQQMSGSGAFKLIEHICMFLQWSEVTEIILICGKHPHADMCTHMQRYKGTQYLCWITSHSTRPNHKQ